MLEKRHGRLPPTARVRGVILAALLAAPACGMGSVGKPAASGLGELFIFLTNIRKPSGVVNAGLYRRTDHFLRPGGEFRTATCAVQPGIIPYLYFPRLPPAEYAVCFYQDLNLNGRVDRGFLGIPLEPFGFCRHARIGLGAPCFDACFFRTAEGSNGISTAVQELVK